MTDRRRLVTALGLGAGLGFVGMPPLRAAETSDEEPWDVLVVGSGAAGLSAALAAYEAGAQRIAILEKMAIAGGHTLVASGSVNAYDPEGQKRMGRSDSTEAFFRDTYEGGGRRGDPDLIAVLVHEPEFCTSLFDPHEEAFSLRNSLNYEGLSGEIDDAA